MRNNESHWSGLNDNQTMLGHDTLIKYTLCSPVYSTFNIPNKFNIMNQSQVKQQNNIRAFSLPLAALLSMLAVSNLL